MEVFTRHLHQHQQGIQRAIATADDDLHDQLMGIAEWLLSQPPLDLIRLSNSDLPSLDKEAAEMLDTLAFEAVLIPIVRVLEHAHSKGIIEHPNLGNIAGAILSSIEGIHAIPDPFVLDSRLEMAEQLIQVFLRGMAKP